MRANVMSAESLVHTCCHRSPMLTEAEAFIVASWIFLSLPCHASYSSISLWD
jgi:hypothetical protein